MRTGATDCAFATPNQSGSSNFQDHQSGPLYIIRGKRTFCPCQLLTIKVGMGHDICWPPGVV